MMCFQDLNLKALTWYFLFWQQFHQKTHSRWYDVFSRFKFKSFDLILFILTSIPPEDRFQMPWHGSTMVWFQFKSFDFVFFIWLQFHQKTDSRWYDTLSRFKFKTFILVLFALTGIPSVDRFRCYESKSLGLGIIHFT